MSVFQIWFDDERKSFRPGERIRGRFAWNLIEEAKAIELRLFWFTDGKGTRDAEIVDSMKLRGPNMSGSSDFSFDLPRGPYSFSGRLISLSWALECVVPGTSTLERLELVMSPTGDEVQL